MTTPEEILDNFLAELAEDENSLALVPIYEGQFAMALSQGATYDNLLEVHDLLFNAYARARGWIVTAPPPAAQAEAPIL